MPITTEQVIAVAKDRAIDELYSIITGNQGYWNLKPSQKKHIQKLATLIALPDSSKDTLDALAKFVDGQEGVYYDLDPKKGKND